MRTFFRPDFLALHDALFEALWKEGRDIGDPEVLVDIAEAHGIDAELVREALDDAALDDELEARFERSREQGIRGIPSFIYGQYVMQGAVPPEQFERLLGVS